MRTVAPAASTGEPFVFEVDVPAHPCEVLGIASRNDWSVVPSTEWISLIPRQP
jgi:hypothetical protein